MNPPVAVTPLDTDIIPQSQPETTVETNTDFAPLPRPDPPTGFISRPEMTLTEQEKREREALKQRLQAKYHKCLYNSIINYHLNAYGYIIPGSNLESTVQSILNSIFMNNDVFTRDEKQEILNLYIQYYNKLMRLNEQNFQQTLARRISSREEQNEFLRKFNAEVSPPIQELNQLVNSFDYTGRNLPRKMSGKIIVPNVGYELRELVQTQFITHGQSNGFFHPLMTIPHNLIDQMLERLRCFLNYCYELDNDYDYGNYRPVALGGKRRKIKSRRNNKHKSKGKRRKNSKKRLTKKRNRL